MSLPLQDGTTILVLVFVFAAVGVTCFAAVMRARESVEAHDREISIAAGADGGARFGNSGVPLTR